MMTGFHQNYIGAHQHREENPEPLPYGIRPIPHLMADAGYFTCLMSSKTDCNFLPNTKQDLFMGGDWNEREPNQPFFARITFGGTHRQWNRDPIRPIAIEDVELPPYYADTPFIRRDWANGLEAMQLVDREVGELLQRLEDEGLADNTLVFFISDHGVCNIRGKQFLYDEGTRIPMIMRWPGQVEPNQVNDDLVSSLDICATVLEVGGTASPVPLHGKSLFGEDVASREYLFAARDKMGNTHDAMRSIRSKDFKLILNLMPDRAYCQFSQYKEGAYPPLAEMNVLYLKGLLTPEQALFMAPHEPHIEIFDLNNDPYELNNLADDPMHADVKATLLAELDHWRNEVIQDQGVNDTFRAKGIFPKTAPIPNVAQWVQANADNYNFTEMGCPPWYPTRTLTQWEEAVEIWRPYVFRGPDEVVKRPVIPFTNIHEEEKTPVMNSLAIPPQTLHHALPQQPPNTLLPNTLLPKSQSPNLRGRLLERRAMKKNMKNIISTLPLLLIAITWCQASFALGADQPNIVVFMADDMGYADTGFTGSTDIKTPNLDSLAASGMTCTNGYVTHPYCGPSRAGLLSGRYQHRFGFETNPAYDLSNPYMGIAPAEMLFPARLQKAGYRTGVIGKWHLGGAPPFHPLNRGFDYFYGFLGGGHDYFRIDLTQPVKEGYLQALERSGRPADFEGYLTTALSNDAAEFVKRNQDQPFFLYVSYNAPHAPQQAPKEAIARYSHIKDQKRRTYAAMVDVMDAGIGKVLTALDENGLRENTLVFFLSDNGGPQPTKQQPGKWNGSTNTPFRGGKGNLYDGGVHVPFVVSWPKRIAAGTKFKHPVISLDIAATAVSVAGVPEKWNGKDKLEGKDLTSIFTGQATSPPHDYLYWRDGEGSRWSVLSADRYKHLKDKSGSPEELMYLPDDAGETNDLAAKSPDKVSLLRAQWERWNQSNQPSRLKSYKQYHEQRDQFFLDAIPPKATNEGYSPESIPTFK